MIKASRHIVAKIATFEGGKGHDGRFHPYRDGGGTWTIGFGHTEGVTAHSTPLSEGEAEALLLHDLDNAYVPALRATLKAYGYKPNKDFSQDRFDACVDMVYNCGVGIFAPIHTIGKALKAHDAEGVEKAFGLYVHDADGNIEPGLVKRRQYDAALWRNNSGPVRH